MKTQFLLTIAIALSLTVAAMAADDPFVGTWKLNVEKSSNLSSSRNLGSVKRLVHIYDIQGNTFKVIHDGENAERPLHSELTFILDGKDHPITGNQYVDGYTATRVDLHTIVTLTKQRGQEVEIRQYIVSKDGKTVTEAVKRGTASNIQFFEKQ